VRGRAGELAPARPLVTERLHRPFGGPRGGTIHDRLGQVVDGQFGAGQRGADGRDDLLRLVRGEADPSGYVGTEDGGAGSAPVHIGRPAVGSGWMVPRGPGLSDGQSRSSSLVAGGGEKVRYWLGRSPVISDCPPTPAKTRSPLPGTPGGVTSFHFVLPAATAAGRGR
jgi:hypothetical protein